VDTYYEYLRIFSQELGARIVEMYPPLQGPHDPISPAIKTLLRQPLPAQALTISGVAKHLQTARSAIIVGECGTEKTLMSVAVAHAVAHTHSHLIEIYMDDFNDYWVPHESINGSGMVPREFDPTIYKPYLSCTFSLPAPSYFCFVASNLRRPVTKVKYTLFLFSPVSEQRSICVVAMKYCH
jgi:hypothetical protein